MLIVSTSIRRMFVFSLLLASFHLKAQESRGQYPFVLKKAYFGLDAGYLHYPFSNSNLAPGYYASRIRIPGGGVRVTLFGYHFTKNLSARITYMRPVDWVVYKSINDDHHNHTVWMNIGQVTARQTIPVFKNICLFAEGGLALITRRGFTINSTTVVKDGSYATYALSGGLQYQINPKWNLDLSFNYSPGKNDLHQPHTLFFSTGFTYNFHPLPESIVNKNVSSKGFPGQTFQFAYSSNIFGYGANHFLGEGKIPVFWGGEVGVEEGIAFNYRKNVFHTRKTFALDVGASIGSWESQIGERRFYTFSVYPVVRYNFIHSESTDIYILYSVAGPTYISKSRLDGYDTGKHFTFRDFMGIGAYFGRNDVLNAEVNIGHFSNGNIYPRNPGIKVPLTCSFGYAF